VDNDLEGLILGLGAGARIDIGKGNNYFEHLLLPNLRDNQHAPVVETAVRPTNIEEDDRSIREIDSQQSMNEEAGDVQQAPGEVAVPVVDDDEEAAVEPTKAKLKAFLQNWYERVWHALHTLLTESVDGKDLRKAAWLLSMKFKQSGKWLGGRYGVLKGKFGLTPSQYRVALCLRLLLRHELPCEAGAVSVCQCGTHLLAAMMPYHFMDCAYSKASRSGRHRAIQDLLVQLIKQIDKINMDGHGPNGANNVAQYKPTTGVALYANRNTLVNPHTDAAALAGNAAQLRAETDVNVGPDQVEGQEAVVPGTVVVAGLQQDQGQAIRWDTIVPDIQFTANGQTFLIDITVGDPATATCVSNANGSWRTELYAANSLAKIKIRKYRRALPAVVDQGRFIPFAMEATGRLGTDAEQLLTRIIPPGDTSLKARFMDQIAIHAL
jgi:hypothetical protein